MHPYGNKGALRLARLWSVRGSIQDSGLSTPAAIQKEITGAARSGMGTEFCPGPYQRELPGSQKGESGKKDFS